MLEDEERKQFFDTIVSAVIKANHMLMSCEMARSENETTGIVMPIEQAESLAKSLGSLAMAFSKLKLFTQEEIEQAVVTQMKIHHGVNLAMQLIAQGAEDDLVESMVRSMGFADNEAVEIRQHGKTMYDYIKKNYPEHLTEYEHHFSEFIAEAFAPQPGITKH